MSGTHARGPIYGAYTHESVGIVLREMIRRMMAAVYSERVNFTSTIKITPGRTDDIVTSGDLASQRIFRKLARACFPGIGIIGEEDDLKEPCTMDGVELYLISDPLDGTKAFKRRQSDGIAVLLALVQIIDGRVAVHAAYAGDVMTGELYGFHPGSHTVDRISREGGVEDLMGTDRSETLRQQYAVLRRPIHTYHPVIQRLLSSSGDGGLVRGYIVDNGSPGLTAAKMWKGEVALYISEPYIDTPWDLIPVHAIYTALGFVPMTLDGSGPAAQFVPFTYSIGLATHRRPEQVVWVHAERMSELVTWAAQTG